MEISGSIILYADVIYFDFGIFPLFYWLRISVSSQIDNHLWIVNAETHRAIVLHSEILLVTRKFKN